MNGARDDDLPPGHVRLSCVGSSSSVCHHAQTCCDCRREIHHHAQRILVDHSCHDVVVVGVRDSIHALPCCDIAATFLGKDKEQDLDNEEAAVVSPHENNDLPLDIVVGKAVPAVASRSKNTVAASASVVEGCNTAVGKADRVASPRQAWEALRTEVQQEGTEAFLVEREVAATAEEACRGKLPSLALVVATSAVELPA